ncbi:MAG: thiamine phosphate synthase [Thermoguttaceae bacterium]
MTQVLRIIDAAGNRAREGLRVVEDYVRFALDDRHLTEQCKRLRHDLAAALGRLPPGHCLAARDTQADVGTTLTTPSEQHRADAGGVLAANFARLQESLRTLEEFGKLLDTAMAQELEQLRYRVYTLQRAVELTREGLARLADARLYVLLDGGSSAEELRRLAQSLVAAGADVLQLRDKHLDDRRLVERARLLREATAGAGKLLIINDRPDVARLAQADGVHLGQGDLSVKDARAIVGPEALIGVSTHSIQQARQAVLDGANYLGVGPTFPSGTKQFEEFPGLDLLRAVAAEIRLPAFAIGGIQPGNLAEVLSAGVVRVAVGGAIATAADPAAVVREMAAKLRGER